MQPACYLFPAVPEDEIEVMFAVFSLSSEEGGKCSSEQALLLRDCRVWALVFRVEGLGALANLDEEVGTRCMQDPKR